MEKVQFQLEATLPELKDLYEKGLFAKNEIDQITKRRTAFETSLIRRQTRKEDFFKYAEYEINLEKLRKVRWKRLKYHLNPPPPSASTYSLPRRAAYILKRATVKFPGDIAVWLAYVEYASREGMRKVVLTGLNSALHHHPLSSTLYLLLSYHHLHPNSPFPGSSIPSTSKLDLPSVSADDQFDDESEASGFSLEGTASARTNILLGLRMIPRSHDLWREYIKLELGWVEGLRRRWKVLGVNIESKPAPGSEVDPNALRGGEGSFGPDGEDARKSILSGQLIMHAINSALAAIPSSETEGMEFRESLVKLLRTYPSALRTKCLEVVYSDMARVAESEGEQATRARFLMTIKELYDRQYTPGTKDEGGVVLDGAELVDALGRIGKEIRAVAKSGRGGPQWLDIAGGWLVQQMALCQGNTDLRQYLFSIMSALAKPTYKPSATFLTLHIEQLEATQPDPSTLLIAVRSHAAQHPANPSLQRMRLVLEVSGAAAINPDSIRKAFKETTKACLRSDMSLAEQQDVLAIWTSFLDWEESQSVDDPARLDGLYKRLLRETLRQNAVPELHPSILAKYFDYTTRQNPTTLLSTLERITSTYRPSYSFFREAFDAIALRSDQAFDELKVVYRQWRAASQVNHDKVGATLYWAEWLLDHHHGKEASDAVDVMRREVAKDTAALADLDAGWTELMNAAERREDEQSDDDDEDTEMEQSIEGGSASGSEDEAASDEGEDVDMVV